MENHVQQKLENEMENGFGVRFVFEAVIVPVGDQIDWPHINGLSVRALGSPVCRTACCHLNIDTISPRSQPAQCR